MAVAAAAEMLNTEVPVFTVNRWMQTVCRGKKKKYFIDTACASKQICWHWSTLHTRFYGCLGCLGVFISIFFFASLLLPLLPSFMSQRTN